MKKTLTEHGNLMLDSFPIDATPNKTNYLNQLNML